MLFVAVTDAIYIPRATGLTSSQQGLARPNTLARTFLPRLLSFWHSALIVKRTCVRGPAFRAFIDGVACPALTVVTIEIANGPHRRRRKIALAEFVSERLRELHLSDSGIAAREVSEASITCCC